MNGALPPSSSDSFFTVRRALRHQRLADRGRAGERQLADGRIRRQLAADIGRRAGDDVEHPSGHARRARASSASASAENGVCDAGFSTTVQPGAIAGPALRVIIAIGKFHGVMQADDADRLLDDDDALVGLMAGDRVAVDAFGFLAEPFEERRAVGHFGARFGQRLALLDRHQARQILLVGDHQLEPAPQDLPRVPWPVLLRHAGKARAAASMAARVSAAPSAGRCR